MNTQILNPFKDTEENLFRYFIFKIEIKKMQISVLLLQHLWMFPFYTLQNNHLKHLVEIVKLVCTVIGKCINSSYHKTDRTEARKVLYILKQSINFLILFLHSSL